MKLLSYIVGILIAITLIAGAVGYTYFVPDTRPAAQPDPRTLRSPPSGQLVGFVDEGVATWLGIPFAQAPLGDLRWRAPQTIPASKELREALTFGPSCPQFSQNQVTGSEDCLFLNIWSPEITPTDSSKRPVMLWIHGGGNSVGDASTPIYHGTQLSREHDLVVVSIQYRLGPLGWFRHPALRDGVLNETDISGNFGTLDIIEALQWVQKNISHFGGDPDNVTIFGESAGAFNVLSMMASPLAKGLFAKAISQSGGLDLTTIAEAENYTDATQPGHRLSSREIVNKLLIQQGIAADRKSAKLIQSEMSPATLAKTLRGLTPETLLGLYSGAFAGMLGNPDLFADGFVLPAGTSTPAIFSDQNAYNAVPVILGTNRDETKLFTAFGSKHVEKTLGLPSGFNDLDAFNRDNRYATDGWKIRAVDELADAMLSAQVNSVYAYRFDVDDWHNLGFVNLKNLLGAAHALEIPFVFNQFIKPLRVIFPTSMQTEFDVVAAHMGGYWAQFAHTGTPSRGRSGALPEWTPWTNTEPAAPRLMVFDTLSDQGIRMVSDRLTRAALKRTFLADTSFTTQSEYCTAYKNLFSGPHFDAREYAALGGGEGCN